MANQEIRQAAKSAGVKLWQVADALGMVDSTFSRKLRHEFSKKEKTQALAAIETIRNTDKE